VNTGQFCRSCGAPVLWVTTINNKAMPLDPEPVEDGNLFLTDEGVATVIEPGSLWDHLPIPRYVSHFVSCPDRDQWRKKR